jgi:hypothetical protein
MVVLAMVLAIGAIFLLWTVKNAKTRPYFVMPRDYWVVILGVSALAVSIFVILWWKLVHGL